MAASLPSLAVSRRALNSLVGLKAPLLVAALSFGWLGVATGEEGAPQNGKPEGAGEKDGKEAQKRRKEEEVARLEEKARKAQEKRLKEELAAEERAKKEAGKEDRTKEDAKEGKKEARKVKEPEGAPKPPTRTRKTGEAFNDYVVDFETVFATSFTDFEVDQQTRHDYKACEEKARKLEDASRSLLRIHEDRLRQFGNDYHHDLELLAINAHRLRVAVGEHHHVDIYTYWAQLRLMRDRLAVHIAWSPKPDAWDPNAAPQPK